MRESAGQFHNYTFRGASWLSSSDPPRGILRMDEAMDAFRLARFAPDPSLAPWIENYWAVEWDLGDRVFVQENIPNPSVNLTFEDDPGTDGPRPGLVLTGVWPRNYKRALTGSGRVFGVKFLPGMFRPWIDGSVASFTGRAADLTGTSWPWAKALKNAADEVIRAPAAERPPIVDRLLSSSLPVPDPTAAQLRDLVLFSRTDRSLRSVGDMAEKAGMEIRSLQRRFLEYVGIGPKWIIRRYRIHQAIDFMRTLGPEDRFDEASLALDLGYYDQAHFCREFLQMTGERPTSYRKRTLKNGRRDSSS